MASRASRNTGAHTAPVKRSISNRVSRWAAHISSRRPKFCSTRRAGLLASVAADRLAQKLKMSPDTLSKSLCCRPPPRIGFVLILHTVALAWYSAVWLWHLTPQAAKLPGAKGFGWFTRYLTFYSFSLQLLQLLLCCIAAVITVSRSCKTHPCATERRFNVVVRISKQGRLLSFK